MIGVDIVSITRFEKFLRHDKALPKYLCDEEILLVTSTATAAGFFAAKEAVSKALKTGIGKTCSFKDIKIHKDTNGAPYFTLTKNLITKYNIKKTSLSISHDGGVAIAIVSILSDNTNETPLFH